MSRTVDLHHHVIPDFYWEASNEEGNAAGGITPPRWSVDGAIAYLDDAGIALILTVRARRGSQTPPD
ncbi:MAG: 6-methylsalicylate decarboxylase [Miltoncostaeaceae bacterium]|nr:6-methylsalicylate decarboxylase [Miltoncostaeaceae bacterium]